MAAQASWETNPRDDAALRDLIEAGEMVEEIVRQEADNIILMQGRGEALDFIRQVPCAVVRAVLMDYVRHMKAEDGLTCSCCYDGVL